MNETEAELIYVYLQYITYTEVFISFRQQLLRHKFAAFQFNSESIPRYLGETGFSETLITLFCPTAPRRYFPAEMHFINIIFFFFALIRQHGHQTAAAVMTLTSVSRGPFEFHLS
jgi:hypothetical protein